jgi:hypothetical protein
MQEGKELVADEVEIHKVIGRLKRILRDLRRKSEISSLWNETKY